MDTRLPPEISYNSKRYPFVRFLGRGGSGAVGLYGETSKGFLVLKVSYCNAPNGKKQAAEEVAYAEEVSQAGLCAEADVYWRAGGLLSGSGLLRAPLSSLYQDGCAYSIYEYAPENLSMWLKRNVTRKASDVVSLFLQVLSILRCLKRKGFYYDDLKPSNLLVWDDGSGPRIKIGDLGGLDKKGDPNITVTPSRLPPDMVSHLSWGQVDVLTSFLLGEILLQLIMRPPSNDGQHPMVDFLSCLQGQKKDACIATMLSKLRPHIADGLSLDDPHIRDLAALALNLLGYQNLYIAVSDIGLLSTPLYSRRQG